MGRITFGLTTLGAKLGAKILPLALKLTKIIKIGKFGLAIGSMASYVYLFTWQFAIIIMISLFFHETGHLVAMKRCGLKTKGIYFIPFFGAAAVAEGLCKSRRDEVYIAIMGPIWGFAMAIGTVFLYIFTKNIFFAAVAGWMGMLNLFNLLPINPLDGGRIIKSVAFSINSGLGFVFLGIGIVAFIILTFWIKLLLFTILLLIASLELIFEYRRYSTKKEILKTFKEQKNFNVDLGKSFGAEFLSLFIPSMTKKGIILSVISYMTVITLLWLLMNYMNNVPEVEVARKLFMS